MDDHKTQYEQPQLLIEAIDEMERVRSDPRLLVIIAHGFIELMINTLIQVKCKHGKQINDDRHSYTHATKLLILNELDVLSDHHFRLLKWFNKLRNDFAHDPRVKLMADRLSVFAKPVHRNMAKFDQLCAKIVIDLWMNHMNDIQHIFLPEGVNFVESQTDSVNDPAPTYMIPLKSDPKTIRRVTSRKFTMRITTPPHIQRIAESDDEP